MRVFVSHIHEEASLAVAIKEELLACFGEQISVFLAEEIPLGSNWLIETRDALKQTDLVLVLFSHWSASRAWINIEAGYAFMAGKQVLPLCHSGYAKDDLPVIYRLLQAVQLDQVSDIGRLLDDVARNTAARRLLVNRAEAVSRWANRMASVLKLLPTDQRNSEDPPCVWLVGSNRGLDQSQAQRNQRFLQLFAQSALSYHFHIVFGRSDLLDHFASTPSPDNQLSGSNDLPALTEFAHAHSLVKNKPHAPPNPVVILGSLRAARGPRSIMKEAIGRVPDACLVMGGSLDGRTPDEVASAVAAGIPVLPLAFTGGFAANAEASFDARFADETSQVQHAKRDFAVVAVRVCDLIVRQTQLGKAGGPHPNL